MMQNLAMIAIAVMTRCNGIESIVVIITPNIGWRPEIVFETTQKIVVLHLYNAVNTSLFL